jgi:DnaK suppressor protein
MALTKEQLKYFEQILKEREGQIKEDLSDFTRPDKRSKEAEFQTQFPDYGSSEDENALEVTAYGDRLSVEGTLEKEVKDIEVALKRIKEGVYGICKYCGKDIGEARLKVRPSSSACVECKKKFKGEK